MSRLRPASIAFGMTFVVSLMLARVHPFGDAGLGAPRAANASAIVQSTLHSQVPPEVGAMLDAKCADCHSMQTRTPLYGRFAPVSWLMERDIVRGRKAMNLTLWDSYPAEQQQTYAAKIVQETKARRMPLPQYRLIHWDARVTAAEEQALVAWSKSFPAGGDASGAEASDEGNATSGREIFNKRCTGCHSLDEDREGPRLRGVFGRAAGSVDGYDYSAALKKSHLAWNDTSLDQWLADPDSLVPENNMEFHVAKPQERRDLIRFLKESANK